MIRLGLGDVQVTILDAGRIRLDGGAMFGVVPRVLWERERKPDERNRIELGMNLMLVEDGRRRVLVDSGAGSKWDEAARDRYGLEPRTPAEALAPAGVDPASIDVVVNSHLHFDHAGGNTVRDPDGSLRAAFPNAEYVVQKGDLEFARRENDRTRASYYPENYEPLVAQGRVRFVEGDADLGPGIRLRLVPGHTPWLQAVLVSGGGRTVAFLSDLVPTASHVAYGWIMAYDLDPLATLATKKRVLPEAVRQGWVVVFPHDASTPAAILEERAGKLRAKPDPVEA